MCVFAQIREEVEMSSVSDRLRQRRKQLGLTQHDLALLTGLSVRFIHDVENGKPTVQLDKVQTLAEGLGLSLELTLRRPQSPLSSGDDHD